MLCHYWHKKGLDTSSAARLVHAFVVSHVDYCNTFLAYALKATTEVRPRFVTGSSHQAAFAGCSRASRVQARHHDVQLSTWSSAAVPAQLLSFSLWCRATSPIRWSTTARCTASEVEYICPTGFLCGQPIGVEFAARLPERSGSWQRHFL